MKNPLGLVPLLVAAALSAAAPPQSPDMELQAPASPLLGDPARGRRVFIKKKCVECHAILGRGGELGPDLAEVGKGRSFYATVAALWDHSPRMIESMAEKNIKWPTLKPEQMADLISYMYFLNFYGKPGDYKKGKDAFRARSCIMCHSIGGDGGDIGPKLDDYGAAASPLKMVTSMWNHGPAMVQMQLAKGIETPKFTGSAVADILAFLKATTAKLDVEPEYARPGDPKRGRSVFEQKKCASCHPVRGVGDGLGPDLAQADLRRGVSEIAGVMWNHGPLIWKELGENGVAITPFTVPEMTDLVSYLYFIEYYDPHGDVDRGKNLYTERGCKECHQKGARDRIRAPDLGRMASLKDPVTLATAFWNHAPAMIEAKEEVLLRWPRFNETEMRDLATYLRSGLEEGDK